MTSNDLLDAFGKVDDAFVEEAAIAAGYLPSERKATNRRHTKHMWLVAAAVALVVLSCASWLMLHKGSNPSTTPSDDPRLAGTSSAPVATASKATEFVWPEDEFPYPRAAILELLEARGLTLEDYLDMLQHPEKYYMSLEGTPWENGEMEFHGDPLLGQKLLELRIGGLYLGQPREEVLALYGEPDTRRDSDDVSTPWSDGTYRDRWQYRFGEEQDLRIEFVDAGDGFVVNKIDMNAEFQGERPLGLYVGQPFEEAEAAFRADPVIGPVTNVTGLVYEEGGTSEGHISAQLTDLETGTPGWLAFSAYYFDYYVEGEHCVQSIHLGSLYPDPPQEEIDPEQEEINRRFNSDEITVWLPEAEGWQGQTWQEEEAKVIWAQLSVALPEPWEYDGSDPIAVLDFHNGYAAALFDEQEHGAVYRVTDRVAFEAGLSSGDPLRGLELWEYGRFSDHTLQSARDPYTVAADWDLPFFVGARFDQLLPAIREKNVEIFTANGMNITLFREKGHYVIAGVFDGGEKITAYGRFFEDHTLYDNTRDFPMIELDEPAKLLGLDLSEIEKTYGKPIFEEKLDGETCPSYITCSGYIIILHLDGSKVTAIDLYDHDPTPVTIR